jgi:hypothetical protein
MKKTREEKLKEKLKERHLRVRRYLNRLGLKNTKDLTVILTDKVKYGVAHTTVRVNPYLSDEVFDTTFAHELLHYFGVPHNESTRHVGFSSNSLRRDLISKAVAKMLRE